MVIVEVNEVGAAPTQIGETTVGFTEIPVTQLAAKVKLAL